MTSQNIFSQFGDSTKDPVSQVLNIFDIDAVSGAPANVRTALSGAKSQQDKLATLQKYYPESQALGDRLLFKNPNTGRMTYVNPQGPDAGDIGGAAGGIGEFVGGTLGAVAGTAAAPGIGSVVGAGVGAVAGREAVEAAVRQAFPTVDSRGMLNRAGDATVTFLTNAIGQKAGEVLQKFGGKAIRKVGRMVGKGEDTASLMNAYVEIGAQPTAGTISGSKTIQQIESSLQGMPVSADVLDKSYQSTIDAMDKYSRGLISSLGGKGDAELAGEAAQKGVEKFAKEFSFKGGKLYDELDKFVKPGTQIATPEFNSTVKEVMTKYSRDPEFAEILTPKTIKMLSKAVEATEQRGGMAYSTWQSLRKQLANEMSSKGVLDDVNTAEIKRLYGAISDDMGTAASGLGDDAFKAFNRANSFWRAGRTRLDDVLTPLVSKSNGVKIYNAVTKGSPKEILALRKSIPKKEWNQVVAQVFENLGRATPGAQSAAGDVFSPATFLTNYNKMSAGAKRQLFGHDPILSKSIDNLSKVAGAIKDMANVSNTSKTAQAGAYMGMLLGGMGAYQGYQEGGIEGAATGAAGGFVTGAMAPYAASKLMTSRGFVNWLADSATVTVTNPKAVSAHILRLHLISEREPHVKEEIRQYLEQLQTIAPQAGDTNNANP